MFWKRGQRCVLASFLGEDGDGNELWGFVVSATLMCGNCVMDGRGGGNDEVFCDCFIFSYIQSSNLSLFNQVLCMDVLSIITIV